MPLLEWLSGLPLRALTEYLAKNRADPAAVAFADPKREERFAEPIEDLRREFGLARVAARALTARSALRRQAERYAPALPAIVR